MDIECIWGAKQAITALIDQMPSDVLVGLRTYPAAGDDCSAGDLRADIIPPRPRDELERQVRLELIDDHSGAAVARIDHDF